MARIRTIKPETAADEKLGKLSRDARLTFILLWTECDDYGRFRASPHLIRGHLFSYDEDVTNPMVASWLAELEDSGRILTYEVEGQTYAEIVNWGKHQRVDNAGKEMVPPPISPKSSESLGEPPRDSETPKDDGEQQAGGSPRNSESLRGSPLDHDHDLDHDPEGDQDRAPAVPAENLPSVGFDAFWSEYPHKVGKPNALKAWTKYRRQGVNDTDILLGARRWAEHYKSAGTEAQFIPHPTTWLNRRGWEDEPPPIPKPKPTRSDGHAEAIVNAVNARSQTALPRASNQ